MSDLLKHFILEYVTPDLKKDNTNKSGYFTEPLKGALIVMYIWKQYDLKMDHGELNRLCSALCLPKMPKDDFLLFWTNIQESFACLKKWVLYHNSFIIMNLNAL